MTGVKRTIQSHADAELSKVIEIYYVNILGYRRKMNVYRFNSE